MHVVWQKHHVLPCVYLGLAAPTDRWCAGCRTFVGASERVQAALEQEAAERAKRH